MGETINTQVQNVCDQNHVKFSFSFIYVLWLQTPINKNDLYNSNERRKAGALNVCLFLYFLLIFFCISCSDTSSVSCHTMHSNWKGKFKECQNECLISNYECISANHTNDSKEYHPLWFGIVAISDDACDRHGFAFLTTFKPMVFLLLFFFSLYLGILIRLHQISPIQMNVSNRIWSTDSIYWIHW